MRDPHMTPITAPGLPNFPQLWYNRELKEAYVRLKLTTWRSHEWARFTVTIAHWTLSLAVAIWLWYSLPFGYNKILQGFLAFLGWGFFLSYAGRIMHNACDKFVARQIFPSITQFWFTPEAIAFRSNFYETGVVIDREWHNLAVICKFDIHEDYAAQEERSSIPMQQSHGKPYLQTASMLRILISTYHPRNAMNSHHNENFMRALPIAEIDQQDAHKITVVLTAAASLTASDIMPYENNSKPIDIDAH